MGRRKRTNPIKASQVSAIQHWLEAKAIMDKMSIFMGKI